MISKEIEGRIARLQGKLQQQSLDGALVIHPVDVYYFSGTRQNAVLWVPVSGDAVLMVRKSLIRARQDCPLEDIRPFPRSKEFVGVLGRCARVGLMEDVLPVQQLKFYARLLPSSEFIDISGINRELRSVKTPWELQRLRKGGEEICKVFAQVPSFLCAGMREIDLAAEFALRLRQAGSEGPVRMRAFNQELFGGLVVSGDKGCEPGFFDGAVTGAGLSSASPQGSSSQNIQAGRPIMIDYTATFDGYIVDMTRMFVVGNYPEEAEKAFSAALDIQSYVQENLRAGQICCELFEGACQLAANHGLLENFMGVAGEQAKFVGHGVGLELDEFPVLAKGFENSLVSGQVIAVEPKFVLPGIGVVGIENTFVVSDNGGERITCLADDLVRV